MSDPSHASPQQPPPMRELLRDATLQLRRLRARVQELEAAATPGNAASDEPIAIVGMACRFPGGANTPEAFWRLLDAGVDAIGEVPSRAWDGARWHDPAGRDGSMVTRHGGFLEDDEVMTFDPACFGISPRDAERMDPQQRLLLEVAHEALENAGLPPFAQRGSATGVFVGTGFDDYARRHVASGDATRIDAAGALGTHRAIAAGRVAYVFGLQGPTMQLDTTCSSSLLAVHLACQSLRHGEAQRMLAGGVSLMLAPEPSVAFSRLGALSADGRCRSFDAEASGYARGEGCGLVVLERLSDALAAGRPVLAVLRGSAVNHDGASNGLTAPSGPAQVAVIRAALVRAGLNADAVQYVEAHGTATPLGDPIELLALHEAYGSAERTAPLWVGSVKTNIGHLEAAAGVAGLMKTVLALQHGRLPAHLHLRTPNPRVPWQRLALQVPRESVAWPATVGPRRAAVSSFGMSGTNVHVVLEAAPVSSPALLPAASTPTATAKTGSAALAAEDEAICSTRRWHLLPVSGRHAAGLQAHLDTLAQALAHEHSPSFAALSHALAHTRSHGPFRRAFAVADIEGLRQALGAASSASVERHAAPRVAFLFTGQGAQRARMGRTLYRDWPVFRVAFDRCAALADARLPRPLAEVMWGQADTADLDRTGYAQPALFALQFSLVELWRSWGVLPHCVLGHSVGEYAAAVSAGVMSLPDAMGLLLSRAQRMQALPAGGAMAALQASAAVVAQLLPPGAEIAVRNGAAQLVIAGSEAAVAQAVAAAQAQGIAAQRLNVSHAFHSALMTPMLDAFAQDAASVPLAAPRIAMISSLSGRVAGVEVAQPEYWVSQVRAPVAFDDALATLQAQAIDVVIEIGPQPVLLGFMKARQSGTAEAKHALLLPSLRALPAAPATAAAPAQTAAPDESAVLLASAARLYEAGATLDWAALAPAPAGSARAVLPNSPFVRRRCWIEPVDTAIAPPPLPQAWPGRALPLAGNTLQVFERVLAAQGELPWQDHRVAGRVLLPAAASLCAALATALRAAPGGPSLGWRVEALQFEQALWLPESGAVPVQIQWQQEPAGDGPPAWRWSMHSQGADASWQRHVQGRVRQVPRTPALTGSVLPALATGAEPGTHPDALWPEQARPGPADVWPTLVHRVSAEALYARLAQHGFDYGAHFQSLAEVASDGAAVAIGRLRPSSAPADAGWHEATTAAAWLDAGLQLAGVAAAGLDESSAAGRWLPAAVGAFEAVGGVPVWVRAQRSTRPPTQPGDPSLRFDLHWFAEEGRCVARLEGLRLAPVSAQIPALSAGSAVPAREPAPQTNIVEPVWQAQPWPASACWPEPDALAAKLHGACDAASQSADCADYLALQASLERLSLAWAARAVRQLGGADAAVRGVSADRQALLACLLQGLEVDDGNAGTQAEQDDAPALQAALMAAFPGRPELELIGRCGAALADILCGRVDALAVLFPGGDVSLLTALYEHSPGARVMNGLLHSSLQAALVALPVRRDSAPLRVLEIGAGTGGSTAHLLPALAALAAQGQAVDYLFTDVSPHFLNQARERFAGHAFLRFGLLDIEAPRAGAEAGFDLVIAANVLHATADIQRTLGHVAARLSSGGLLLLLEATTPLRWLDLVFGTMPGWWRFTDHALRPAHPLLSAAGWCDALRSAGFDAALPLAGTPGVAQAELPQTVLLARRAVAQRCRVVVGAKHDEGADEWLRAMRLAGIDAQAVAGDAAFKAPLQAIDTLVLPLPQVPAADADADADASRARQHRHRRCGGVLQRTAGVGAAPGAAASAAAAVLAPAAAARAAGHAGQVTSHSPKRRPKH